MTAESERDEVGRWLRNFVASHAKRESPRVEAVIEASGDGEGLRYAVSLVMGERRAPARDHSPLELSLPEIEAGRARLAWCEELAARVRGVARGLVGAEGTEPLSA